MGAGDVEREPDKKESDTRKKEENYRREMRTQDVEPGGSFVQNCVRGYGNKTVKSASNGPSSQHNWNANYYCAAAD